jgi:hypothetical protein
LEPKFPGAQISRGSNLSGTKFPRDQKGAGPTFLGHKFLGDQISWGPKKSGAQMNSGTISVIAYSIHSRYSNKNNLECSKPRVEILDGIPYFTTQNMDDERKKRIIVSLWWQFDSADGTANEEKLLYDSKDLLAWVGGALGVFVGCSIFDILSQIIILIFFFVDRVINKTRVPVHPKGNYLGKRLRQTEK